MNPGGLVLVIVGVVVISQVTLGNALGRLGISGTPDKPKTVVNVDPKTHVPNTNPNLPYLRDQNGRPY